MTAHEGLARRVPWLVAAVSLWLTAGVVSPTGPEPTARIGVLPPFWIVPALLLAAAAIGPMIPCRPARLRPLYLSLLLWLPWLPLPIPAAFLLWHGPLSCVVWIVIAGLLVAPLGRAWWDRVLAAAPTTQIALVILLAAGVSTAAAWRMAPVLPGGDEPHYLVIAQSLLYDGDLKIENNHRRGDYRAYIGVDLKPDYLRRGVDREIYSIHAPGLPVLVLPAFAVAGYPGVLVFLSIVSAVGAALVWRAAWRITGDASAAWAGWASVALSAPFLLQSFTAYPDGPAAVLVMTGVYGLALPESMSASRWRPAVLGAALAALPWLHTRYAVLAGVLGVLIVWRLWQPGDAAARPTESTRAHPLGRCLAFLAIPVVSAAAWLWSFYAIYGELNPAAPYGGYTQSSLANAPRGLVGLLIDQQFGVLPNAPVYVVAFMGVAALWHRRRRVAIELLLVAVPYTVAVGCYHMWWGGYSSPARFLVPVLLPFGVAAAAQWTGSTPQGRSTFAVLLGVSIVLAAALVWVDHGALVYNFRDGFARWMDRAAPLVNLPRALPTQFRNARLVTAALVVAWAGAALASWLLARLAARAWNEDGTAMRGWCALACTLMIGATLGWRIAGAAPLETGTGLLRVAGAAAGRGVVVTLPALRRETPQRAFANVRVPSGSRRDRRDNGLLFVARNLPAGRYRVIADAPSALAGTLDATVGRGPAPFLHASIDGLSPGATAMRLDLPAGAQVLTISGDAAAVRSIGEVSLRIETFDGGPDATLARRVRQYGDTVVWFLDEGSLVEAEGWWVRGRASAAVLVDAPRNRSPVPLLLRNGGVPNRVTLTAGAWSATLGLAAREEQLIDVPAVARGARLQVASATGFRPSDVDAASKDARVLGVWVQVR